MKYLLMLLVLFFVFSVPTFSHCQIPCGIFEDHLRFELMKEHITTIEKSIKLVQELSLSKEINYNQLIRWVNNKEEHANELSHILTYYFLDQRIKPVEPDHAEYNLYVQKLIVVHKLMVFTMKTKQSTDLSNIAQLRQLHEQFRQLYFGEIKVENHKHCDTEHSHKH